MTEMLRLDSAKLEMRLGSACRLLSTDAFSTVLDLVHEGVPSKSGLGEQEVANLVRLSSILLREASEGKGSHDLNIATVSYCASRHIEGLPSAHHKMSAPLRRR